MAKARAKKKDIYVGGEEGKIEEVMPARFCDFWDIRTLFLVLGILLLFLAIALMI